MQRPISTQAVCDDWFYDVSSAHNMELYYWLDYCIEVAAIGALESMQKCMYNSIREFNDDFKTRISLVFIVYISGFVILIFSNLFWEI